MSNGKRQYRQFKNVALNTFRKLPTGREKKNLQKNATDVSRKKKSNVDGHTLCREIIQ